MLFLAPFLAILLLRPCKNVPSQHSKKLESDNVIDSIASTKTHKLAVDTPAIYPQNVHYLEALFLENKLVNIHDLDTSIQVNLRYGSTDNVWEEDLYGGFDKAFFQPEVAEMLVEVQKQLKSEHPQYSLLIWDATRPRHVQQKLFTSLYGTPKQRYVATPSKNALHTYGAAVDLSLCDSLGTPIDMGTDFDHFGELAELRHEKRLREAGVLTMQQQKNRWILRAAMRKVNFHTIPNEWWHFNAFYKSEVWAKYQPIE